MGSGLRLYLYTLKGRMRWLRFYHVNISHGFPLLPIHYLAINAVMLLVIILLTAWAVGGCPPAIRRRKCYCKQSGLAQTIPMATLCFQL